MTTRLATVRRRSLPVMLALLCLAGWTTSIHAAAPSPQHSPGASTEKVVGPAIPWQFAPGLLAPGLMPEAYYVTTGTTTTATTVTTTTVGKVPGNGGNTPGGGGGPGITIQGNPTPNSSPEPASLVMSMIGVGFVTLKLWRRRFKKAALPEMGAEEAVEG